MASAVTPTKSSEAVLNLMMVRHMTDDFELHDVVLQTLMPRADVAVRLLVRKLRPVTVTVPPSVSTMLSEKW